MSKLQDIKERVNSRVDEAKAAVSAHVDGAKAAMSERVGAVKETVAEKQAAYEAWRLTPTQKALLILIVVLASMIMGYKQWIDLDAEIAQEQGAKVAPPTFSEHVAEQMSVVGGMVRRKAVDVIGEKAVANTERKLAYLGDKTKKGISRTAEAASDAAHSAFTTATTAAGAAADAANLAANTAADVAVTTARETGGKAKELAIATKDKTVNAVQSVRDEYQRKKDAEQAEKDRAAQEIADRERARELTAQTNVNIIDGNERFMKNDLAKADELFRSAVSTSQTGEQQYRAWRGVAMVAQLQGRGKDERTAGQQMLELSVSDKDKANAYAAIANGEFALGNYSPAIIAHRQSAQFHNADGNVRMAWTTLAEAAKIARANVGDYKTSANTIKEAWDLVDAAQLDDFSKREAKWNLCLDYADNCRLQGDRRGQVNWNREACDYNPAWKQTADMIERELRDKGLL